MQQCSPDKVFWKCFIITIATTLLKCLDLQFAQLLHHLFRKFPSCQRNTKIMNFDRCLTQDDLSYIMKSTRTLKTSHICLAKEQPKVFQLTIYLFDIQAPTMPDPRELLAGQVSTDAWTTKHDEKVFFFFSQAGQWTVLSLCRVRKKGILVENGRFSARAWYKPSD